MQEYYFIISSVKSLYPARFFFWQCCSLSELASDASTWEIEESENTDIGWVKGYIRALHLFTRCCFVVWRWLEFHWFFEFACIYILEFRVLFALEIPAEHVNDQVPGYGNKGNILILHIRNLPHRFKGNIKIKTMAEQPKLSAGFSPINWIRDHYQIVCQFFFLELLFYFLDDGVVLFGGNDDEWVITIHFWWRPREKLFKLTLLFFFNYFNHLIGIFMNLRIHFVTSFVMAVLMERLSLFSHIVILLGHFLHEFINVLAFDNT